MNPNHWFCTALRKEEPTLPPLDSKLNVRACLITNVKPEHRVFSAPENAVTSSDVPGFRGTPVSSDQCAFALARTGAGLVSYFGDVNAEEETTTTVQLIAVCGPSLEWMKRLFNHQKHP